jgi:integrase
MPPSTGEWRLACGRPPDDALVFPGHRGGLWNDDAWRYWRRRVFGPAARSAGIGAPVRPYDLRHSFVSLLIAEGANVVEIARQAGHSPTITLSTYAHLFDERPPGQRTAENEIPGRAAGAQVPKTYPIRTRKPTRALP